MSRKPSPFDALRDLENARRRIDPSAPRAARPRKAKPDPAVAEARRREAARLAEAVEWAERLRQIEEAVRAAVAAALGSLSVGQSCAALQHFGLPANATLAELKASFRARARAEHPDRGGDAVAFRKTVDAYRVALATQAKP